MIDGQIEMRSANSTINTFNDDAYNTIEAEEVDTNIDFTEEKDD